MQEGFKIIKSSDVVQGLKEHRDTYKDRGKYLGWDKMHKHYSMTLGNCTDWTGFPRSGKTELLEQLLINTSLWYGWKHLIYFPDVGDSIEIIADLLQKKTGKTFDPTKENTISDAEIVKDIEWIVHHFKVLVKEEDKATLTPVQFWDIAIELKETEGLQTASIDSWKDMSHPYSEYGGYGGYLEYILPYRNTIAQRHNLHLHIVIHPKETEKAKSGKRKPPAAYDLKGGPEWFNSGKCMITVHREDMKDNRVDIYFNKIKPRSVGYPGRIELWLNKDTLTYFDMEVHEHDPNTFLHHYAAPSGVKNTITTGALSMKKDTEQDDLPF